MGRTIKFEPRAVAFLDILGFKEVVREAHAGRPGLRRLSRLIQKLRSNAPLNRVVNPTVPRDLHPRSLEISDSIILSTPLTHRDHPHYWGLEIMMMRCSQIASILLEEGYLLSGAINMGPIQHTQRNIVGLAYQDAYLLQSAVESPAIVLCPDAATQWRAFQNRVGPSDLCSRRAVTFKEKDPEGRPVLMDRETEIVNVFEPIYMNSVRSIDAEPGPPPTIDDVWLSDKIQSIEALINGNLKRFAPGSPQEKPSVLGKWQWFGRFFSEHGKPGMEERCSVPFSLMT